MNDEPAIAGVAGRTAAILTLFALVFTALMAATYRATLPTIQASTEEEKMKLVDEVLPRGLYDNLLLADYLTIGPLAQLGLDEPVRLFRARKGDRPAALVFEMAATEGYGGRIRLIVAAGADGRLVGVRVVSHKETPGLGDYIDPRKDRNKAQPWIRQFDNSGFEQVPPARWKVKKDGGLFDSRAGATISARAVTHATRRALQFAAENRDKLYALPAKSAFDAPTEKP